MSRWFLRILLSLFVLGAAAYGLYRVEERHQASRLALAETVIDSSKAAPASRETPATAASPAANSPADPSGKSGREGRGVLAAETALPLRSGEILDFRASVWHLKAFAHTENPLRFVFALDDQFDSYSDAATLHSMQYELHLNERGQKLDSVQRLTSSGNTPAAAGAVQTRVLPGTRDPLGMMQFLRTVDWSRTPEVRCPVYDGHKLYDVRANVAGSASITVPAGTFDTSKIAIRVFDNGAEMKDASFALYLAKDPGKTPVLLEAVLPFASARVELNRIH